MEKVPNPAAWLGRFWDRLPPASQDASIRELAKAFQLKANDPRIFRAIESALFMAQRTEEAVRELRIPERVKEHNLSWKDAFGKEFVLQIAANGAWVNCHVRFTAVNREHLRACEIWLDEVCANTQETSDELEAIAEEIESLRSAVASAKDVSEEFRILLLETVEALRRAIAEYELRGALGVQDALGEIFGFLLRRGFKFVKTEADSGFWTKALKILAGASTVGATAKTAADLYIAYEKIALLSGG